MHTGSSAAAMARAMRIASHIAPNEGGMNARPTKSTPFLEMNGTAQVRMTPTDLKAHRGGHVQIVLPEDETELFGRSLPSEHQEAFDHARQSTRELVPTSEDVLTDAGWVTPDERPSDAAGVALGRSKVSTTDNVRSYEMRSLDGVKYMNTHRAERLFEAPLQLPAGAVEIADIGKLSDSDIAALASVDRSHGNKGYSLSGQRNIPWEHWTDHERAEYFRTGIAPKGLPNCTDQFKADMLTLARHKGASDPALVWRLETELQRATRPQEVLPIILRYFGPDADGNCTFKAPAPEPLQGRDLSGTAFYEEYRKASGMEPQAFAKLARNLSAKGVFFDAVFSNEEHRRWGLDFFTQLGERLKTCEKGRAVAVVSYFPDCYEVAKDGQGKYVKGSGIVHVSPMAITPEGDLCINHHESVKIASKRAVDHLMPGALGVLTNTYDNRELFERAARATGAEVPELLPIELSVKLWGPPSCVFTDVDYAVFEAMTEREANRGRTPEAFEMTYAASPDPRINNAAAAYRGGQIDLAEAIKAGGERLALEPKIPSPVGSIDDASPRNPSEANSCAHSTLIVLKAAGCPNLANAHPSANMSLVEADKMLHESDLMPDTPKTMTQEMENREKAKPLGTATYKVVGNSKTGQTMQPGEGIRSHVPRNASYEHSVSKL